MVYRCQHLFDMLLAYLSICYLYNMYKGTLYRVWLEHFSLETCLGAFKGKGKTKTRKKQNDKKRGLCPERACIVGQEGSATVPQCCAVRAIGSFGGELRRVTAHVSRRSHYIYWPRPPTQCSHNPTTYFRSDLATLALRPPVSCTSSHCCDGCP